MAQVRETFDDDPLRRLKTEPLLALLMLDGAPRQTCLGCSKLLADKGMLEVLNETALNVDNGDGPMATMITYAIAPGFTLADCRAVIRERHVGPEWGS